ncbi:MAG TPA: protein translocase subunit SecF [Gammaproteobacteria bacterium]|nr:protein translocase subunit SecF [Gammaproteobacteria bacterium]
MQIRLERTIDFMGKRKIAFVLSTFLVIASLVLLATRGLNLGIDFTGGTVIEVAYEQPADLDEIRSTLASGGFKRAIVQYFGDSKEVLIRLAPHKGEDRSTVSNEVIDLLKQATSEHVDLRRVEFVGPQIGEELKEDGGLAMIYALFCILVYVAFRFEYRFSFGAIIALVHDVVITVGFFALTQMEFDLTVLAAVLAVIGYSLNDTIVVYDRIRENFRRIRKGDAESITNTSINQTLGRTLVTSLTTLLVLIALDFFGGEIIHSFAIALIVGVVVGTYSSIYVASNAVLMMGISKEDLIPEPVDKEGELENIP